MVQPGMGRLDGPAPMQTVAGVAQFARVSVKRATARHSDGKRRGDSGAIVLWLVDYEHPVAWCIYQASPESYDAKDYVLHCGTLEPNQNDEL